MKSKKFKIFLTITYLKLNPGLSPKFDINAPYKNTLNTDKKTSGLTRDIVMYP